MLRLRSIDAFFELRDRLVRDEDPSLPTIVVPAGTCGQASGANDLIRVAKRELLARGLSERVRLRVTGCHGFCQLEPSVLVTPARTFYPKLSMAGMVRVVEAVAAGRVLEDLLYLDPESGARLEQICTTPPPRTIIGTIEAPHATHGPAPESSALQWGQKKSTTVSTGISCCDSTSNDP